jgi:hypothetical protein
LVLGYSTQTFNIGNKILEIKKVLRPARAVAVADKGRHDHQE